MPLSVVLSVLVLTQPRIVTAAGTGEPGFSGDGGPAARAQLNLPFYVAFDTDGHLFFSDTFNHRIRRIDARTGVITTVAGNGGKGYSGDGGPATRAALNEPYGVAVDRAGDVYFADRLNRRVRKVDGKTEAITTIAGDGSGKYSGDGGPAVSAGLAEPNSVALDASGRLYIADVADHRVRVVELATGIIQTFAGTGRGRHEGDGGPPSAASIRGARAVEVGPDGTVYVLEREGHSLRAVDPATKTIRTIAGTGKAGYSGDGGPAARAELNGPKELVTDHEGNLFIVDTENHAIRRISMRSGTITTVAGRGRRGGGGDGGPAAQAELDRPHGVALAPDGSIWIADTGNNKLRKVDK